MPSLLSTTELQFSFNIFASIAFVFFLLILFKEWKKSKAQKLPPGPWRLPLIGSLHHLVGRSQLHILRDLPRKYGPLMHLQVGEVPTVIVSSPQMAKEIIKTHDPAFADRLETLASNIMWYNKQDIAFCPYGDYWRQMRKLCTMELLSPKSVRSFDFVRQDVVSRLVESIRSSSGEPINLTKKIFLSISAMICRAAFGKVCKDQETLIVVLKKAFSAAGGFDVADLFPSLKVLQIISGRKLKLVNMHQQVDMVLEDIINEHKKNFASTKRGNGESGDEDLVDVLLRLKESGSLQIPIGNDHIKAVIFDMFSGGTDTSSSTIEWAVSELMKNPRVMAKVQAEIRQTFNRKKSIDESDLQGLGYFKSVIKETLRLHPPLLLVPRLCREDREIIGYFIPAGTRTMVNLWAIGRDPDHWLDPECFLPERFEQSSIDFTGTHFEYIPFGAGRRICPGMSFGLASVELLLAQLLFHFNWKLPGGMDPNDLDMTEAPGLTAGRKHNLYLVATPYNPSIDDSCPP